MIEFHDCLGKYPYFYNLNQSNGLCFSVREEAFGPVAPLLRFKTEEEAIRIANDTNAGTNLELVICEGFFLFWAWSFLIYRSGVVQFDRWGKEEA